MEIMMNKSETRIEQDKSTQSAMSHHVRQHSSPGDSSVSATPKDVWPGQAAAKDVTERKTYSDNQDERQEALLDEAIDLTFPASDPISVPSYESVRLKPQTETPQAIPILDENSMSIVVPNTQPDAPRVTLFGQLDDGHYTAAVMDEDAVPYTRYWDNAIDQAMVYIEPDDDQLSKMVAALNEGRLDFSSLQDFGSSNGGTSIITIS
jgi:hypothetical protein